MRSDTTTHFDVTCCCNLLYFAQITDAILIKLEWLCQSIDERKEWESERGKSTFFQRKKKTKPKTVDCCKTLLRHGNINFEPILTHVQDTVCDLIILGNKNIHSLHYIQNESNLKLLTIRNFQSICKPLHCHDKTLIRLPLYLRSNGRTKQRASEWVSGKKTKFSSTDTYTRFDFGASFCSNVFPITHTPFIGMSNWSEKNSYQKHFAINHFSLHFFLLFFSSISSCWFCCFVVMVCVNDG